RGSAVGLRTFSRSTGGRCAPRPGMGGRGGGGGYRWAPPGAAAAPPPATAARRRLRPATLFTLMALVAVVMLYPFYYMLNSASRTQAQFEQQNGHSAVSWRQLFTELPVWRELANSTIICVTAIALILIV